MMLALLLVATDSLAGNWSYRALGPKGELAAKGSVSLRAVTAADRKRLRFSSDVTHIGTKSIKSPDERRYGPHGEVAFDFGRPMQFDFGDGVPSKPPKFTSYVQASLHKGKVRIDLNAGYFDHNIILTGRLQGSKIAGTWGWGTIAGYRMKGKFEMVRKDPRPTGRKGRTSP